MLKQGGGGRKSPKRVLNNKKPIPEKAHSILISGKKNEFYTEWEEITILLLLFLLTRNLENEAMFPYNFIEVIRN